jgi:uncharacterized protein
MVPPLPATVESALGAFRHRVDDRFGARVREVVLFGSYARGEATEESDVDVLVVIQDLTEGERREVFDFAYDAGAATDDYVCISPLPYSETQVVELRARERRLLKEIDRDGVAV